MVRPDNFGHDVINFRDMRLVDVLAQNQHRVRRELQGESTILLEDCAGNLCQTLTFCVLVSRGRRFHISGEFLEF